MAALWLGACAAPTSPHKQFEAQMSEHLETKAQLSQPVVTRAPESWQFFAFIFCVVYTFGVNFGGAVAEVRWTKKSTLLKVVLHLLWFVLCLWVILFTAWGHNVLVRPLMRAKQG
jgi:hypothetical protein